MKIIFLKFTDHNLIEVNSNFFSKHKELMEKFFSSRRKTIIMRKYFGTNGIRGVVGELITPDFVIKMTSAIATIFKRGPIVVGRDARLSSPFIKNAVLSSILASGIEVIDIGVVPTPLTQFAVKHLNAEAGIMITASHNPPEFNGIKVIDKDGVEIDIKKQLEIERVYKTVRYNYTTWEKTKDVTKINLISDYIERIISFVDQEKIRKAKLKVVVDAGNGVGAIVTPYLLQKLGIKVITLNAHLDGSFPGRGSEPIPEKLTLMANATIEWGANFSIAHDGDADRAIFGDEKGQVYYGDKSIALFEKWLLKEKKPPFVTPVSSSMVVEKIANELGIKVVWTPVGCIYVSRKMMEIKSMLGGEENGGLFYAPHQPVRDGAMAAALMAEMIAMTGKQLGELIEELPKYYQFKDKVKCENEIKEKVMENVKSTVKEAKETIDIDGVKAVFEDGWVLIRPSGTEPIIRIFVEAKTKQRAKELIEKGKNLVKQNVTKWKK